MSLSHNLSRTSNLLTRQIAIRYAKTLDMYPLIEYPKCGGTWVSRMLAGALELPNARYARLPIAMPSVIHGHWKFHPKLKNATYLTRDGRDVMVSFYFHFTRPSDNPNQPNKALYIDRLQSMLGKDADLMDIKSNLPRFIEHIFANPVGCRQNWRDHCTDWFDRPNVSTIKYEDLRHDCVGAMVNLVSSLGHEPNEERIQRVVDHYSMQRMTGRKPGQEDSNSFIRKGIVGDWKNHFTKESAQIFDQLAGDVLIKLGYEQDAGWVDSCDGVS